MPLSRPSSTASQAPARRSPLAPPPPATPRGTTRPNLDSWDNYMEMHVIWIDAGPSPAPDPGAVVQCFNFVP